MLLSRELSRQIGNRRRAMAAGGRTDLGTIAQFEVTARWYLFQLIVFGGFALAFPKHTPGPVHSRQRWLAAGMRLAAALNL
ncbi:MAG: hypothetical protein R2762_10695 [Bryobacteraceae bacterium]